MRRARTRRRLLNEFRGFSGCTPTGSSWKGHQQDTNHPQPAELPRAQKRGGSSSPVSSFGLLQAGKKAGHGFFPFFRPCHAFCIPKNWHSQAQGPAGLPAGPLGFEVELRSAVNLIRGADDIVGVAGYPSQDGLKEQDSHMNPGRGLGAIARRSLQPGAQFRSPWRSLLGPGCLDLGELRKDPRPSALGSETKRYWRSTIGFWAGKVVSLRFGFPFLNLQNRKLFVWELTSALMINFCDGL